MVFYKWEGDSKFLDKMRKEEKKKKEKKKIYNKKYYDKKEKKYCKYCDKDVTRYDTHRKSYRHKFKKLSYKN